jgi:predicted lactoylglutathione lyase
MKPRISIITLAVDDLERSLRFYRDGLGLPTKGIIEGFDDHVLFEMQEGLSLVLYMRKEIDEISGQANGIKSSSECILSYAATTKEEVENILNLVISAGGSLCGKPKEQPWAYFAYFKDPDGHLWEIIPGAVASGE